MSAGVGVIVLAAIFAAGVVLFTLLAASLLPGAVELASRLDARRRRRAG